MGSLKQELCPAGHVFDLLLCHWSLKDSLEFSGSLKADQEFAFVGSNRKGERPFKGTLSNLEGPSSLQPWTITSNFPWHTISALVFIRFVSMLIVQGSSPPHNFRESPSWTELSHRGAFGNPLSTASSLLQATGSLGEFSSHSNTNRTNSLNTKEQVLFKRDHTFPSFSCRKGVASGLHQQLYPPPPTPPIRKLYR